MITKKTLATWASIVFFFDTLTCFAFLTGIVFTDSWFDARGMFVASLALFGIGILSSALSTKVRYLRRLRLAEMRKEYKR